jgi:endonuclease/exonuclease/phosphatase family metal-dependent hydrolase
MISLLDLNVRFDNPQDGPHRWEHRRAHVFDLIAQRGPDWIALQEVLPGQRRDFEQALPAYRTYGVPRDGKGKDECCLWMVRDPWRIVSATTWWLSETPQQVSRGWDACLPRVASVVRLSDGTQMCQAVNVHLDHLGVQARAQGLSLIASRLGSEAAVVCGDFNQDLPQWPQWSTYPQDSLGTFHGFQGGLEGPQIDGILLSAHWKMLEFERLSDASLSDHYPLWIKFQPASIGA